MTRGSRERARRRLAELESRLIPGVLGDIQRLSNSKADEPDRLDLKSQLEELRVEAEIIRGELARAEIPCGSVEAVVIGSIVTFVHLRTGEEQTLTLISQNGRPLEDKTTSVKSPVGEALLGAREGDIVQAVFVRKELGRGDVQRIEEFRVTKICAGEEEEAE